MSETPDEWTDRLDPRLDVLLEVEFVGREFSANLIANMITVIEESAYHVEFAEIGELQGLLPDADPAVFDAMRYRATRYRGRAVNVRTARTGSLILMGIVAGLSYWLLDKTLGETVKEAWKKSGRHDQLVKFLSERRWKKAEAIVDRLGGPLREFPEPPAIVVSKVEERSGHVAAVVTVVPDPQLTTRVPSQSEVARSWQE